MQKTKRGPSQQLLTQRRFLHVLAEQLLSAPDHGHTHWNVGHIVAQWVHAQTLETTECSIHWWCCDGAQKTVETICVWLERHGNVIWVDSHTCRWCETHSNMNMYFPSGFHNTFDMLVMWCSTTTHATTLNNNTRALMRDHNLNTFYMEMHFQWKNNKPITSIWMWEGRHVVMVNDIFWHTYDMWEFTSHY